MRTTFPFNECLLITSRGCWVVHLVPARNLQSSREYHGQVIANRPRPRLQNRRERSSKICPGIKPDICGEQASQMGRTSAWTEGEKMFSRMKRVRQTRGGSHSA